MSSTIVVSPHQLPLTNGCESHSASSPRVTVEAAGISFVALHPDDASTAVDFGTSRRRTPKRRAAGDTCEVERRRRDVIAERMAVTASEEEEEFWQLPDWLNAEREWMDDGSPGVYCLQPSKEDFESRFEGVLAAVDHIGRRIGAVKIRVPDECLGDAPADEYPEEEPTVFSMAQYLPLHTHSTSNLSPVYSVVSKDPVLVPVSSYPHPLTSDSAFSRIPESTLLARGRSWEQIMAGNPGGGVVYSSDNDATPQLRFSLCLSDPKLCSLPGNVLFEASTRVTGIHTPYLYLGNPYTLFALHMEDYSAYSLNYHHVGAPKMWRIVSPLDFATVEDLVAGVTRCPTRCSQFVRHESVFLSSGALETAGIRSVLMRQEKGDLVITWPLTYHQGWNEGSNICEALGYGDRRWKEMFCDGGGEVYTPCGARCLGDWVAPIRLEF